MNTTTQKPLPGLALCILMDLVGYASFAVPVFGEFFDVIWAPFAALVFNRIFGGKVGILGGAFTFIEELLPFTDFIPSFSIAWFVRNYQISKSAKKAVILAK